jgi:hypothetical protein
MNDEDIDARLTRLQRDTSAIRARSGFATQVMSELRARKVSALPAAFARDARRIVVAAALVALIALGVSWSSQHSLDSALATGTFALGAEW